MGAYYLDAVVFRSYMALLARYAGNHDFGHVTMMALGLSKGPTNCFISVADTNWYQPLIAT